MEAEYAKRRILQCASRHHAITKRLQEIEAVDSHISSNNDVLYTTSGKLTVQRELLRELDAKSEDAFKAYKALTSHVGKRALSKLSGARAKKVERAKRGWESAYETQRRVRDLVQQLDDRLENCMDQKALLARHKIEFAELTDQLEDMYDSMFGIEGVPEWPHEHSASSWHAVNKETARYLAAEAAREKRARENLYKAKTHAEAVVRDLQAALRICITTGVASNTKYTKQLFQGNSALGTSRATTPVLLNAKTNSGKLFTAMAETRGGQPFVQPLPTLEIIELHTMPGRGSAKAVSEQALQRRLEVSYTQAKVCVHHVISQLAISRERSKGYAQAAEELAEECETSLRVSRAIREEIIEAVLRHEEPIVPPLGRGEGGLDGERVKRNARDALRRIIRTVRLEAEGGGEDEELPGYEYAWNA